MITPAKIDWYRPKEQPNYFSGTIENRVICDITLSGDIIIGKFLPEKIQFESDDLASVQNSAQQALNKYLARNLIFESDEQKIQFLRCHLLGIENLQEPEKTEAIEVAAEESPPEEEYIPPGEEPPPSGNDEEFV